MRRRYHAYFFSLRWWRRAADRRISLTGIRKAVTARQAAFRRKLPAAQWESELRKARLWREECGRRQEEWDAAIGHTKPFRSQLVLMLRRLAGINQPIPGYRRRRHLSECEATSGMGYHGCTSDYWDNSVRAWDENR